MQSNEKDLSFPNPNAPLIRVEQSDTGNPLVSAREIYNFLGISERFSKWIERMLEYGFTENQDYTLYQKVHPQNNQIFDDYALTLDTAKEIAMVQRSEKGKQARQYFIDCEKQLKQPQRPLTQGEILLQNAQMLVNIERKQLEQDKAIASITQKQEEAEGYMDTLRKEPIRAMQVNTRKAVDALVKNYAVAKGVPPSNSYNLIYKEFSLRYHRDIFNCAKRQKISCISWIEEQGYIAELYEVAKEVLIY